MLSPLGIGVAPGKAPQTVTMHIPAYECIYVYMQAYTSICMHMCELSWIYHHMKMCDFAAYTSICMHMCDFASSCWCRHPKSHILLTHWNNNLDTITLSFFTTTKLCSNNSCLQRKRKTNSFS